MIHADSFHAGYRAGYQAGTRELRHLIAQVIDRPVLLSGRRPAEALAEAVAAERATDWDADR